MMKRPILLSAPETDALDLLGRRVRLARLRRNLSQAALADRAGVTRKTYIALEQGRETVNIGLLVKVMAALGYLDRLPDLLAADPLGEEMEEIHGRQRGSRLAG